MQVTFEGTIPEIRAQIIELFPDISGAVTSVNVLCTEAVNIAATPAPKRTRKPKAEEVAEDLGKLAEVRERVLALAAKIDAADLIRIKRLHFCEDIACTQLDTLLKLEADFQALLSRAEAPKAEEPKAEEEAPALTRGDVIAALTKLKEAKGPDTALGLLPSLGLGKMNTVPESEYPRVMDAIKAAMDEDSF